MKKIKSAFIKTISIGGILIHVALWLLEMKTKKTKNKWDDKIVDFLKRLL